MISEGKFAILWHQDLIRELLCQ